MISHTPPDDGLGASLLRADPSYGNPTLALSLEPLPKNITARDDVHPETRSQTPGGSIPHPDSETPHRGFGKSLVEKSKHALSHVTVSNGTKKQYEYLQLPGKPKATKKEEADKSGAKPSDEETLNIIAQALKEVTVEVLTIA